MVKSTGPGLVLAGLMLGFASVASAQDAQKPPEGVTPEQIAQGKALFAGAAGCQMCHGPGGKGTPMATPLADTTWVFAEGGTFEAVVEIIMNGLPAGAKNKVPMPAASQKKLTEEQVKALATYVLSLSRPSQ